MREHVKQWERDLDADVKVLGQDKHVKKVTPAHIILARMRAI
ncbi:hypothetical protein AVEN_238584-1, partial [Araneus ventricosus]